MHPLSLQINHRLLRLLAIAAIVVALPACTRVKCIYPDHEPDQVWTALVAVAETPNYEDPDPDKRWFIKENHVTVFEDRAQIEIYRELHRYLHRARTKPIRERRSWRFTIDILDDDPMKVRFTSRGWGVPMQARAEGVRFFDDVSELLRSEPLEPADEDSPPAPEPIAPTRPEDEPAVDIEDLVPGL